MLNQDIVSNDINDGNVLCRKDKGKAKNKGKETEEKDKRKEQEQKGKKGKENENPEFSMKISALLPELKTTLETYKSTWSGKSKEDSAVQGHNTNMVQAEKLQQVETEVRKAVDDMMRLELVRLNEALDKDRGLKKKKKKKKGG
jgi:uncharacterized protein YukE